MKDKKMLLCSGLALAALGLHAQEKQPNIVIYLADDHGFRQSNPYGDDFVRTPNMAALSTNGMTFDRAYAASPASGPSRSALLSSMMPARNGAEANHTMPRPETQGMIKQLKEQGYEVVAIGKIAHSLPHTQMQDFDSFIFGGTDRAELAKKVEAFLDARHSDKPLCLMVGDRRPHVPWIENPDYAAGEANLPDYLVDTPQTREHWVRYLTDITELDRSLGEVDNLAKKHFGRDDYMFIYSADHGGQWPFGKWNLYEKGVRVPFIVRWPGKVAQNVRTNAMVSWIDLMPTLIEVAGGKAKEGIDGYSFADVLYGKTKTHRDLVFTTTTSDGDMNIYPMRAVRDDRFKYIRNLHPEAYHSNHSDILRKDGAGAYWNSWDERAKTDPAAAAIIKKYYQRPPVELYDLKKDPEETTNLANNPKYAAQLRKMSALVDQWMVSQGDESRLGRTPYPLSGPTPYEVNKLKEAGKVKEANKKK